MLVFPLCKQSEPCNHWFIRSHKKKKNNKQRSRAHWKVTACSYLMLGTAWNQSLKQSLQEVFWPQSHSLVMTVLNCLQKLNQWLCLSSPSMDTRCGIQISLNLLASPNAATQHDIHLRGKSSNWDWVTRSSVPFFPYKSWLSTLGFPHNQKTGKNFLQWFIEKHISILLSCLS